MTEKTILYTSKAIRDVDIKVQHGLGFRCMHMNNRGRDFEVIYDDTPDQPPPPRRQLTESEYTREQMEKENIDVI